MALVKPSPHSQLTDPSRGTSAFRFHAVTIVGFVPRKMPRGGCRWAIVRPVGLISGVSYRVMALTHPRTVYGAPPNTRDLGAVNQTAIDPSAAICSLHALQIQFRFRSRE